MLIEIPPKYSVAQVVGYIGGIYQREKRYSDSPEICREAKKLHGTKLLGKRVLCVNSRPGRSNYQEVYSGTRNGMCIVRAIFHKPRYTRVQGVFAKSMHTIHTIHRGRKNVLIIYECYKSCARNLERKHTVRI
jgi:hypothetical protein